MITPGIYDGTQYYKFGDNVTFVWNYTHVIVSPTAVNVLAVISDNSQDQTWTIRSNMSIATTSIVWDTRPDADSKQTPLVMGMYSLVIYDNAKAVTAAPSSGYLSPGNYPFGMYSPRAPTPLASYECAICDKTGSGGTNIDTKLIRMLFGTGAIFVASLFWFARSTLI